MTNSTVEAIIKRKSADLQGFFPWPLRGFFDDHFSVVGSEGSAEVPSSRKRLTIALNHNERNATTKGKPNGKFSPKILSQLIAQLFYLVIHTVLHTVIEKPVELQSMNQERKWNSNLDRRIFQRFFSIFLVEKTHNGNWKSSWRRDAKPSLWFPH